MSWAITLDSVNLMAAPYNIGTISDDDTAERDINSVKTNGVDGIVILDDRFESKTIRVSGVIYNTTPALLQASIDSFNELCARKDKNLDITPDGGSARRYIVRMIGGVKYDRQHYNNLFVTYSVNFLVVEGIGRATASENVLTVNNITTERSPTPTGSHTVALAGSAKPKPTISFHIDTKAKADLLTLTNDSKSQAMKIEMDSSFVAGDDIVIDTESQIVTKEGVQISFKGVMPDFEIGNNLVHVDIQGATQVIDQSQTADTGTGTVVGNNGAGLTRCLAQSFVCGRSGFLKTLKVYGGKTGTPGAFQVRVFTDNGNKPYQNLVAGESGWVFAHTAFPAVASAAEVTLDYATSPYYLQEGVKYWLVITTTNSAGNYYTLFGGGTGEGSYANGMCVNYDGATTAPTDPASWADFTATLADLYFKTYTGQGGSPDWQIDLSVDYTKRYL